MNETDLKDKLRKQLRKLSAWCFSPVQTGMGQSGVPDIIACVPYTVTPEDVGKTLGLFIGIEAKMDNNVPTPLQEQQLTGIREAHGKALVATGKKVRGLPYKVVEWRK